MKVIVDSAADLPSHRDLWQNDSSLLNVTAANTSSVYMSPVINKTINVFIVVALTITMAALGCTVELSKIKVRQHQSVENILCVFVTSLPSSLIIFLFFLPAPHSET